MVMLAEGRRMIVTATDCCIDRMASRILAGGGRLRDLSRPSDRRCARVSVEGGFACFRRRGNRLEEGGGVEV